MKSTEEKLITDNNETNILEVISAVKTRSTRMIVIIEINNSASKAGNISHFSEL